MSQSLIPSSLDKVAFTNAFWKKWGATKTTYAKRHVKWHQPAEITRALDIMWPMLRRYMRGDFRHSDEEAEAEHDAGLFLVNQHLSIHKMPLLKEATWSSFSRSKRKIKSVCS